MIKRENGKPKIYVGNMKMSIPLLERFFKEEFAKVHARISKLERLMANNGRF